MAYFPKINNVTGESSSYQSSPCLSADKIKNSQNSMKTSKSKIPIVTEQNILIAPNETQEIIDILVEPSRRKNKVLYEKFDTWDRDGKIIVTASRTPFCDSARALLKRGSSPNTVLRMFRLKAETYDLSAPITVAARLTVIDSARDTAYFSKWRSFSHPTVGACNRQKRQRATGVAGIENKRVFEEAVG